MILKELIREFLIFFHFDLTKNLKYDRQAQLVMKRVITKNSNCVDVGCHKGEILREINKLAPNGHHFAFEPIPEMYNSLKEKFTNNTVYPYALSDKNGKTTFQFVRNAPAYSGIKKRKYEIENPDIQEIEVEMKMLDDVIPAKTKLDFVKIDVEGAEYGVLAGGKEHLKKDKPIVIFECGIGASDFYGTKPEEIYKLIVSDIGLSIFTLSDFLSGNKSLSLNKFQAFYQSNKEYYFIAAPV